MWSKLLLHSIWKWNCPQQSNFLHQKCCRLSEAWRKSSSWKSQASARFLSDFWVGVPLGLVLEMSGIDHNHLCLKNILSPLQTKWQSYVKWNKADLQAWTKLHHHLGGMTKTEFQPDIIHVRGQLNSNASRIILFSLVLQLISIDSSSEHRFWQCLCPSKEVKEQYKTTPKALVTFSFNIS